MYDAIKNQQLQFFKNQARPSAVLSTDQMFDKDQVAALRDRWNEQAKGLHAGGVPILTAQGEEPGEPGGAPRGVRGLGPETAMSDERTMGSQPPQHLL